MAEKKYYDQAKKTVDESTFLVSDENFKLPDMGDYYQNAVDNPYIKMVDEAIRGVEIGDEQKATFYIEKPYVTQLGTHELEGVYFIKARPDVSKEANDNGYFDGDTLYFSKDSIEADNETISRITNSLKTAVNDLNRKIDPDNDEYSFSDVGVRFLGINTPETPKYSTEYVKLHEEDVTEIPYFEAIKRDNRMYIFDRHAEHNDNDIIRFIKMGDVWKEYTIKGEDDRGKTKIRVYQKEGESDPERLAAGIKAKDEVRRLINQADGYVYFLIDHTSLNRSNEQYPTKYGKTAFSPGVIDKLLYWWQQIRSYNPYRYAGYNQWGQDAYGRFLGTPYVRIVDGTGEKWINLAKYLIAEIPEVEVLPEYVDSPLFNDNAGMASRVFRLHTYDFKKRLLADSAGLLAEKLDDRRRIQREIFNRDFDALKEWTVTIGDCTLFVPPTSIRVVSNTTHERLPLIRAKGSMTKGAMKEERFIEMTIYFNDERGINGYEYHTTLPNGEEITYYMNGLRSLIAQFKFTPFLPIDNNYINEVLNIDAVTLANLQISTLPNYPKCIAAVLTLQEFDYLQYMPELPVSLDENDKYRNIFAATINYEVMRWYYQRCIRLGEELSDVDVNSREYLEKTQGHRTALIPMNFKNSNIRFLIANEEHLQQMLQVKLDMIRNPYAKIVLSELEKEVAKDISYVYNALSDLLGNEDFLEKLGAINDIVNQEGQFGTKKLAVLKSGDKTSNQNFNQLENMRFKYFEEIIGQSGNVQYREAGDVDNQIFLDLLETMRREILKTNDLVGKTVLSGGRFVYKEDGIEGVFNIGTTGIHPLDRKKDIVEGRVILGVEFDVQLDYLTNPEQINDLRRDASLTTQLQMEDVFNDYKLFIPLHGTFERDKNIGRMPFMTLREDQVFKLDTMDPDIQFISYCYSIATTLGLNEGKTMNEDALDLKQSIDMEDIDSIVYEEYETGDIRIKNLSCGFGNVFTRVGLSGTSGYAPQYIGGQDTIIEIGIETTDLYAVSMLSLLPRIATQYARDYRLVLPASPLKLDSEITKLLGVNEVVIENVSIDTVPNQPGLFEISMRLVSMDRTLRNREGLKKINDFALSGRNATEEQTERQMQTYFELNKVLAQAEIYPDLELPTIAELDDCGFVFIRHTFDDAVYPDPDFYFVYGHVLQSQIFREAVENFHNEAMNEMTWRDQYGGEVYTSTYSDVGVKVDDANDKAKEQENTKNLAEEINQKMPDEKNLLKSKYDIINTLRAADITDSWNISEDIRTIFLEPAYLSLLDYHETQSSIESASEKEIDASAGFWVNLAMKPARDASELIGKYLSSGLSEPANYAMSTPSTQIAYYQLHIPGTKDDCDKKIDEILADDRIKTIFEKLEIKVDRKFKKALKNIVWAAACAATSEKEYSGKKNEAGWQPNKNFIGLRVANSQDDSGVETATTAEEVVKYGIEFGPYRIKMYTSEEIRSLTGEAPDKLFSNSKSDSNMNTSYYLLDPYFRRKGVTVEEIETYKANVATNVPYATEAFFRLMMFWLKRMIDDKVLPNMSLDVLKKEFDTELNKAYGSEIAETQGFVLTEEMLEIQRYLNFLAKSERAVDGGKMFAAAVMALTNSLKIYEPMLERRYDMLNGMVDSAISVAGEYNPTDMDYIFLRKFLLALVGLGEIKKETDIGKQAENPITDFKKALNEKKYIQAAEDPNTYIKHSFYDMIVTDKRGRMARAFPTFYLVFLDEGREIGLWKLHDNFYSINSINEIQVSKSRKNPADTCRIVISNLFHTLTTDDEDSNMAYEYDWRDVFTSIFNPRSYYLKEEAKRLKQQPLNKVKLTTGTRIHVRMGYGSNAAALPVVFNGMIAEISAGEAVEIIAQGDGVQLLNPILDDTEAHEKKNQDKNPISRWVQNLFSSAATPKTIIDAFLTVEGGFIEKKIREWTNGYYFNDHPLGITHFGDPRYNVIFKAGEPTQNIFEAINKPKWADLGPGISEEWSMKEAPKFTMDVFGKTFWDILHVCGSASPDFVVGIAPFGFRSTIFHGHPRFYYAYEYYQDSDGTVLERRKPFQQYHIYTSFSDIIKNDIRASSQDLKTNAMGLYKLRTWGTKESQEKIGPLWVDWDIYPEHQKSMVFDTQLKAKGVPILGSIIPFLNKIIDNTADDEGTVQSGKEIAWRMTAHALKQSVLDMYQGELIVVGDPSVKPHDRMFIHDGYENMNGSCLVEGCVHNFSAENGFTTTIYPDCIAVVDDRHELAIQSTASMIVSRGVVTTLGVMAPSLLFGRTFTPLLSIAAKQSKSLLVGAAKASKKLGSAKTAKKMIKAAKTAKKAYTAGKVAAVGAAIAGTGGTALVPLAALAIEIAVVQTFANFAYATIERWMKSKQVLQVFPLKKNHKVLTSGLDGSMGLVYGSPTYDTPGVLENLFTKLNTETNGFNKAINFMINLLTTDEMRNIAAKFERGHSMLEQQGATVSEEKAIDKMLKALASNQTRTQAGYRKLLLTPRMTPQDKDYNEKLEDLFDSQAFLDTNGIEIQPRITNETIYVKQDPKLNEAMSTGLFQTAWDTALPENSYEFKEFNLSGKKEQIRAIVVERNGKKLYDIPFLRPDAIHILREIIVKCSFLLPEHDPTKDQTPEDFVMLHSALKVGDEETYSCLGYSFILEAFGSKRKTLLVDAITAIEREAEDMYEMGELTNKKLFEWSTDRNEKGEDTLVLVTVYPPAE